MTHTENNRALPMHDTRRFTRFVPGRAATRLAAIGLACLFVSNLAPLRAQHHNHHDSRALAEDPDSASGPLAPVLADLGTHHHPVTTHSERAQMFFDQGLKLTYGFNHQEALRSFKEAARLDPDCAMAYWGWALVLGPNLNLPMDASVAGQAFEAIENAMALRDRVTPLERGLIEALDRRYSIDPDADRAALDQAYAEAMGALHDRFPDDTDVATLYAASLMNLSPWSYWTGDGKPRDRTDDLLAALESALEADPEHEGALHYYIHAIESVDPKRGEAAADTLRGLAPGAGHLVHMPSHIYMRVGRYDDAYEANRAASEADERYLTQCRTQGIYPLGYYPHNVHFQAWAALMLGRKDEAVRLSRKLADQVPGDGHGNLWGLFQTFLGMPYFVMVRFGMWDEILAEPAPETELRYLRGVWHYAHGYATLMTGRAGAARKHLRAIRRLGGEPGAHEELVGFSNAGALLEIASEVLEGEIFARRGRHDRAIAHLERAVRLEDGMMYNEPPDWYYPVRHTLGAVLLDAGRADEAETVYWRDLEINRDNGFALFGLERSLAAQGRDAEAAEVRERFDRAWSTADVTLRSSRF